MRGGSDVTKPAHLSIVCADTEPLPCPALEYLILRLNTLQTDVEFEFLPISIAHPFLSALKPAATAKYDEFSQQGTSSS